MALLSIRLPYRVVTILLFLTCGYDSHIDARSRYLKTSSTSRRHLPTNFGKTNFIVGFDHQHLQEEQRHHIQENLKFLLSSDGHIKRALFSPDDNIKKTLINIIKAEQSSLKIAIFTLTDKDIADSIIAVSKYVPVEIITEPSTINGMYSKINYLKEHGVPVFCYKPTKRTAPLGNLMHNKITLCEKNINDKPLVITGSFNYTVSANVNNQENIVILDDPKLIKQYKKQFEQLKKRSKRYLDYSATI